MLSSLIIAAALITQSPPPLILEDGFVGRAKVAAKCKCDNCECCVKKVVIDKKPFRLADKNGVVYEDLDKQKVIDYVNYVNLNTPFRLTDRYGRVWEHTDYTWLKTYVDQVNVAACAGGNCPR